VLIVRTKGKTFGDLTRALRCFTYTLFPPSHSGL